MKSKGFSFSLLLCLSITAFSQEYGIFVGDEGLYNLRTNPALNSEQQVEKKTANNLVYIIDTLKLPFVDDFSKNKIKKYNAQITDANVFDSTRVRFTVNGAAKDSIVYSIDTTLHIQHNNTTNGYFLKPTNCCG
jgi:hypothetical protein